MAGGQERVLRRRIRSVQSTKKITRAMELIAASRIVRAHGGDLSCTSEPGKGTTVRMLLPIERAGDRT